MLSVSPDNLEEFNDLLRQYDIDFRIEDDTVISFENNSLKFDIKNRSLTTTNSFSDVFSAPADKLFDKAWAHEDLPKDLRQLLELLKKNSEGNITVPVWFKKMLSEAINENTSVYIPAERILLTVLYDSILSLTDEKVNLPYSLSRFGKLYETARNNMSSASLLGFTVQVGEDNKLMITTSDGFQFPIRNASSGLLSGLPLLMVAGYYLDRKRIVALIEEPELNLFPDKQVEMTSYLINAIMKEESNKIIITTHSPYILSFINALLKAGNVLNEHPEKEEIVKKILNGVSPISYDQLRVYSIKDGVVSSMMDDELRLISPDELDEASDFIGDIFEQLLEL